MVQIRLKPIFFHSMFQDDEYVVYSPDQVKLKYVVQFSIDGDQLKPFNPAIDTSAESYLPPADPSEHCAALA